MDRHLHDHDTGRSEGSATAAFVGGGRVSDPGTGGLARRSLKHPEAAMGWHIADHEGVLTLSRQPGARMDFAVEQRLPQVRSRRRLAHQIRQDMWRALRALRGFSPVVRVHPDPGGIRVEAGGQVSARPFPKARCEAILRDLLSDTQHQARWMRHA